MQKNFDLTPDPKVLIALTHTPMQPMDALCELIDNALDSFQVAELMGTPIRGGWIALELPKPGAVRSGEGSVIIRDNGLGLNAEMAEKALRAGFSGNNPYDSLGLFGMGFNISTGKLGRVTKFVTARKDETTAIGVKIDLDEINRSKNYRVPVEIFPKPDDFIQGTRVEVSDWWPTGNPNSGFILKLVQYGLPKIREELGRRYAAILRENKIKIVVNSEPVYPFEHCVWGDNRFVTRRGVGEIPAVFRFDEVVGNQKRCTSCYAAVDPEKNQCQVCGSGTLRTIEERIRGWVGIQRFEDLADFGIDLIRNGRAIRIAEKTAFFEFIDEFKKTIKDYPIDGTFGRIIGEVHLNHVPVDFLKQDFQRSSPEWQRAMLFLRGESSLQPTQPGADKNTSYIYKLYQGYRRVRHYGKADMYMGFWDEAEGKTKHISRELEQEYYSKFKQRSPGFYDDTEWWKLVEQADRKPLEELIECPECQAQNLKGHDSCQACGYILKSKICISSECGKTLPLGAQSCPYCGVSQIAQVEKEWRCEVCLNSNPPGEDLCVKCNSLRGALDPLSYEFLIKNSNRSDDLSINGCSILLADGTYSSPIDVSTHITSQSITPHGKDIKLLLIAHKEPNRINIFVDLAHPAFKFYGIRAEYLVAQEVATYTHVANGRLTQHSGVHTLTNIMWQIIQARWSNSLNYSPDKIRQEIQSYLHDLRIELPDLLRGNAEDIFENLSPKAQRALAENLLGQGKELTKLSGMKSSGEFLKFLDYGTILELFQGYTANFLDKKFWIDAFDTLPASFSPDVVEQIQQRTRTIYLNSLQDIVTFLDWQAPDSALSSRALSALVFLQQRQA
jgi:hypothetical protein